jgi:hypothetical protein
MTTREVPALHHPTVYGRFTGLPYPGGAVEVEEMPEPRDDALGPAPDRATEADDVWTYEWDTDLTTQQADDFDSLVQEVRRRTEPPDYDAMKPHFDTLKAYYGASAPTQAQTITALKSVIVVLREMWKEDS